MHKVSQNLTEDIDGMWGEHVIIINIRLLQDCSTTRRKQNPYWSCNPMTKKEHCSKEQPIGLSRLPSKLGERPLTNVTKLFNQISKSE